eukprot:7911467-Pyramimonas_sp.AAC.1
MTTTYVNRADKAALISERASQSIQAAGATKPVILFSFVYHQQKLKLCQNLLKAELSDPVGQATMRADALEFLRFEKNRVGRPRLKWTKKFA